MKLTKKTILLFLSLIFSYSSFARTCTPGIFYSDRYETMVEHMCVTSEDLELRHQIFGFLRKAKDSSRTLLRSFRIDKSVTTQSCHALSIMSAEMTVLAKKIKEAQKRRLIFTRDEKDLAHKTFFASTNLMSEIAIFSKRVCSPQLNFVDPSLYERSQGRLEDALTELSDMDNRFKQASESQNIRFGDMIVSPSWNIIRE